MYSRGSSREIPDLEVHISADKLPGWLVIHLTNWCRISFFLWIVYNHYNVNFDLRVYCLITGSQSNLTTGRIAAAHGRFNGILQVAPVCSAPQVIHMLPWDHPRPNHKRNLDRFWATVCKTVRHNAIGPLSVCLSVCLSFLSVMLEYCGQTVGWIKMKLGVQSSLGSGHIVLDENSAPPPERHSPQFSAHICCGPTAEWIKMPLGRKVGLDQATMR